MLTSRHPPSRASRSTLRCHRGAATSPGRTGPRSPRGSSRARCSSTITASSADQRRTAPARSSSPPAATSAYGGSASTSVYGPSRRSMRALGRDRVDLRLRLEARQRAGFRGSPPPSRRSRSTKSHQPAPRLSASMPSAPVPAYRSSTREKSASMRVERGEERAAHQVGAGARRRWSGLRGGGRADPSGDGPWRCRRSLAPSP